LKFGKARVFVTGYCKAKEKEDTNNTSNLTIESFKQVW